MRAEDILKIARAEIGVTESPAGSNKCKYNTWYYGREVSGGAYPWCMVFVQWVFDQAGKRLYPLTASCGVFVREHKNTKAYITKDWQPGDIVFFHNTSRYTRINHVGIYVGNGQFIHAPQTGDVVKISSLDSGYYATTFVTARRIFN